MDQAESCPVSRLEKILVATDTSLFSEGAVREAISFAKRCGSRIYAMTVLETNPEYETIGSNVFEKEEAEVMAYLETVRKKATAEGLECELIVRRGDAAYRQIVDEASARQADMIVIGRRGHTRLARLLMGEVASKVIGHAPCKVLVVPKAARITYRTLLVATDGSGHGTAASEEAVRIAKRCGSTLIVLSAAHSQDETAEAKKNVAAVVDAAGKEGIPVQPVTPVGRAYDAILETAGGRGVDLIIMGTYGKTGLRKLLMGSSTEKVVGYSGCAVLIVNR